MFLSWLSVLLSLPLSLSLYLSLRMALTGTIMVTTTHKEILTVPDTHPRLIPGKDDHPEQECLFLNQDPWLPGLKMKSEAVERIVVSNQNCFC